ncbi:hypothetical protein B0T25DRAFT_175915 [Lasiosphaeria hispida]|uniref:Uncharacterized protein n=1 Tax=Lasiosphaeria hispida TaxID=260671 RepID=A0AAJ0MGP6_9PEZI|nr:hypothetical protein B0T25DRAFT_175915 [Lasiosphaeria hispida]
MCYKKIYVNTYADGVQDVTEKAYMCREDRMCRDPEIQQYYRNYSYPKAQPGIASMPIPYLVAELPTPRRSKSPSPANRRDSGLFVHGGKLADVSPSRHHHHHRHHRRSSRHEAHDQSDQESPRPPKRSMTNPHIVVVDQAPTHTKSRDVPATPVQLTGELNSRRRSSRGRDRDHHDRDRDSSANGRHTTRRRSRSADARPFIIDDEHDRRRHRREHRPRRMSTSIFPEAATTSAAAPADPRRIPRRSNTVIHQGGDSVFSNSSSSAAPAQPKVLRWEDEVGVKRARQNARIANRQPPEVHQDAQPKGILKRTTSVNEGKSKSKGKARELDSEVRELRRAVERMEIPRRDREAREDVEIEVFDKERLRERFMPEDEDRRGRRRSKVWVAGDRYQYL